LIPKYSISLSTDFSFFAYVKDFDKKSLIAEPLSSKEPFSEKTSSNISSIDKPLDDISLFIFILFCSFLLSTSFLYNSAFSILAGLLVLIPRLFYPYPIHIDEWHHITEAEKIVNGEYKSYRGMASKDAQVDWKTNLKESEIVPEGEASFVRTKGKFSNVLHQLVGGLKSGMSYLNARTLKDLRDSEFIKVSNNALIENKPHGKIN
jgi:hypothetical protein